MSTVIEKLQDSIRVSKREIQALDRLINSDATNISNRTEYGTGRDHYFLNNDIKPQILAILRSERDKWQALLDDRSKKLQAVNQMLETFLSEMGDRIEDA